MTNIQTIKKNYYILPFIVLILVAIFQIKPLNGNEFNGNRVKGIFFEYGAESGALQPPWDWVGERVGYSDVSVSSVIVRTGSKSLKLETLQVYVSTAENRLATVREAINDNDEFYISWWVYFPANYYSTMLENRDTLGGFKYVRSSIDMEWRFRFHMDYSVSNGYRLVFTETYITDGVEGVPYDKVTTYNSTEPTEETWFHLQIYWKESASASGILRAWYNNYLMYEHANYVNDPNEWNVDAPEPEARFQRYTSSSDPKGYHYADDIVLATEKVPESYGVIGK